VVIVADDKHKPMNDALRLGFMQRRQRVMRSRLAAPPTSNHPGNAFILDAIRRAQGYEPQRDDEE
jgi:hypothetical protein